MNQIDIDLTFTDIGVGKCVFSSVNLVEYIFMSYTGFWAQTGSLSLFHILTPQIFNLELVCDF